MEIINQAIDWTSVKLNVMVLPFLFINDIWVKGFAIAATISTIIYNGIRIYKEIKKR